MQVLFLLFATSAFAQCLGDYPLQLAVDTAKLVGGPFFESLPRVAVNTQHKTFCGIILWHTLDVGRSTLKVDRLLIVE